MKRIKNQENLAKENIIISLLKSESGALEINYIKHFDHNNNTNDDTFDDKKKR